MKRHSVARRNLRLCLFPNAQGKAKLWYVRFSSKAFGSENEKKGYVAESHYGLGHKPSTVEEAVNIAEVKAAVDQYWDELQNLLALDFKKVQQRQKWFDRQHITEDFSFCI